MRRLLLFLVLVGFVGAGFFLLRDVGWDSLARHQDALKAWVGVHPVEAGAVFLLVYIATAGLSLPHGALLTVAGGLLFGAVTGWALTIVGATMGASILLVVIRSAFANRYRHRIPEGIRTRLERDGFSYLLVLRLVPLFPFWIVNLAAAAAGIRLVVFVPATLLGIAPTSFVLSSVGAGVGSVLAAGRTPDLTVVFTPRVLLPLLALAGLSLVPVLWRRRSGAHA